MTSRAACIHTYTRSPARDVTKPLLVFRTRAGATAASAGIGRNGRAAAHVGTSGHVDRRAGRARVNGRPFRKHRMLPQLQFVANNTRLFRVTLFRQCETSRVVQPVPANCTDSQYPNRKSRCFEETIDRNILTFRRLPNAHVRPG